MIIPNKLQFPALLEPVCFPEQRNHESQKANAFRKGSDATDGVPSGFFRPTRASGAHERAIGSEPGAG